MGAGLLYGKLLLRRKLLRLRALLQPPRPSDLLPLTLTRTLTLTLTLSLTLTLTLTLPRPSDLLPLLAGGSAMLLRQVAAYPPCRTWVAAYPPMPNLGG